jgi:uncharacterized protein YndB with AHSA1/START domain
MTMPPLELQRHLDAPPEEVWRAWTDPAVMQDWYCPNPRWRLTASADVRVGGGWQVRMGDSYVAAGRYLTVARPRLLGFTWAWASEGARPPISVVEVELVPADGGTRLLLRHTDLPTPEEVETHQQGWQLCLDRLAALPR